MKRIITYVSLLVLFACQPDVNRDLQINQSFEGEEAYWASKSLDEHLYLVFQPWALFDEESFLDSLPGCPEISRDTAAFSVTLNYDRPGCTEVPVGRKGSITLEYGRESPTEGDTLRLTFTDYEREGTAVVGQRVFRFTELLSGEITVAELTDSLRLLHPEGSSTRLKPAYLHRATMESNKLIELSSQGQMQGRNWSGNAFEVLVDPQKLQSSACLSESLPRPASGTETWTIHRTGGNPVTHELVYTTSDACESRTTIRLDEGVDMEKTP